MGKWFAPNFEWCSVLNVQWGLQFIRVVNYVVCSDCIEYQIESETQRVFNCVSIITFRILGCLCCSYFADHLMCTELCEEVIHLCIITVWKRNSFHNGHMILMPWFQHKRDCMVDCYDLLIQICSAELFLMYIILL